MTERPNPYKDLTMEQALQVRDAIETERWNLHDQLDANRVSYGEICHYIYGLIQQGLQEE